MKSGLKLSLLVLAGMVLGAGSAVAVLSGGLGLGGGLGSQTVMGWTGNHLTGAKAADPYTRALVAKRGLLALNQAETIYFSMTKDDQGQALKASCVYSLEGGRLPARWWSVTIYDSQDFLPVNGDDAQSVDATRTVIDAVDAVAGRWSARVAPDRGNAKNWISSKNAEEFSLTLRLYNPESKAQSDFASIPFPTLKMVSCAKGAA